MFSFQQMLDDHAGLDALATDLVAMVDQSQNQAQAAASALRAMSSLRACHVAAERDVLACESSDLKYGDLLAEADLIDHEFADVLRDWPAYLAGWNEQAISAHWLQFAEATRHVMARLREKLVQENERLYPLALRTGRLALRASYAQRAS